MDIFPQFQFKLLEYYSVTVLFVKLLDGNGQNQVLLSRMIVNKGKKRNGFLIKEDRYYRMSHFTMEKKNVKYSETSLKEYQRGIVQ